MNAEHPIWPGDDEDDEALARHVAARLGLATLPAECVAGVAVNARLLQRHLETLRASS